jgi:hypothetical protein
MESNKDQSNTYSNKNPSITDYLIPLQTENLIILKRKVESIIKFSNLKLENSLIINHPDINYDNSECNYFKLENSDNQYNTILDLLSFIHTDKSKSVKDKGTVVYLIDYHFMQNVFDVLKTHLTENNNNFSLLVKVYVIEKIPLVSLLFIQKFNNKKCDIDNLKLLHYEMYDDLTITKPVSYLFSHLHKSLTYMYEMFQYQEFLKEYRPGNVLRINVKENFWSDNIDYTLNIVDSDDPELIKKQSCAAIIVSKSYVGDFIYITREGNLGLCKQVQSSRLILIRPNAFNNDDVNIIKEKISHYILLFKFRDCVTISIPIMLMSDNKKETYELFKNDKYIVRDIVENDNKDTFRQLIFTNNIHEVQSEMKLILVSNKKSKSDDTLIPLPTNERFASKKFRSCLDPNFISSFYIKTLLCGLFLLEGNQFPSKPFNILILGAGIGTINHFFNKICKGRVNITSVEIDKEIVEIGKKYFGLKNDESNYTWIYSDALEYLKTEKEEKKYDIIIIDINNTNPLDGISPPPAFFEDNYLNYVKVYLFLFYIVSFKRQWDLFS